MSEKQIGLAEAERQAMEALKALLTHFCLSQQGIRNVAEAAYTEWLDERKGRNP